MFFYRESPSGPADPYFSSVSLLIKADGANNSTVFTDSSNNNLNITTYDGAKISTADSKYGGSSAYFDGTSDYIAVDNSDGLNFGAEDFTLEMWMKPDFTGNQRRFFAKRPDELTYGLLSYISRPNAETYNINIYIPNSAASWIFYPSFSIPAGEWVHLALVRNGNDWYYFVNGTKHIIALNTNITIPSNNGRFFFGTSSESNPGTVGYKGYMDDIRITKGVGRYTENFTPPDSHPTT
jgi:hypothetical protein